MNDTVWPLGTHAPVVDGELGSSSGASNLLSFKSPNQNDVDGVTTAVGLGDLASLTVANESENGAGKSHMHTQYLSYKFFIGFIVLSRR